MDRKKTIIEILIFTLIVGLFNFLDVSDPGFVNAPVNPYSVFACIVATYYGKHYGVLSIITSLIYLIGIFPLVSTLFGLMNSLRQYWISFFQTSPIDLVTTMIGVYIFGILRDIYIEKIRKSQIDEKYYREENERLKKEVKALKIVNGELQRRISRKEDSLATLYTEVQKLFTHNLNTTLHALLSIVVRFTGATSCSVWQLIPGEKRLILQVQFGWDPDKEHTTELPGDHSIEGWVVRNNLLYSLRMLLKYPNLQEFDRQANILTVPILINQKSWGVLNIEELPFEKYNSYTEKMLQLIGSLSTPAIEKAHEYESLILKDNINPVTGFSPFSNFYIALQKELYRTDIGKNKVTVFIFELTNFSEIIMRIRKEGVLQLFLGISRELERLCSENAYFYHYKNENQISLLETGLDYDGASFFALEALGIINTSDWYIHDQRINPEIIIGYSTSTESENTVDELLGTAENLIEMQKI